MQIPCANKIVCQISLTGPQKAHFIGRLIGYVDIDFSGVIRGLFIGSISGEFCGTINGEFHGLLDGVQFDGPINQYVCGEIVGNISANLDGQFNGAHFTGHLIGFIDAFVDGDISGTTTATFNGTIDGFPTDPDFPVTNLSAELPDTNTGFPPFQFVDPPFTGGGGLPDSGIGPNEDGTTELPPGDVVIMYTNSEQSYTITCPDLTEYTQVVPPGLFSNLIQSQADADALAFAIELAQLYCDTATVPSYFTNTPQTCSVTCPTGGTSSYTAPVNTYSAVTQEAANDGAYSHACVMANLLCTPPNGDPPLPPGTVPVYPPGGLPPDGEIPESPPTLTGGGPGISFTNSAQTAIVPCPSGGTFAYTVKTGRFFGSTAAVANAAALSYAIQQANALRFCLLFYLGTLNEFDEVDAFNIPVFDDGAFLILIHQNDNFIINNQNPLFNFPYSFTAVGNPPVAGVPPPLPILEQVERAIWEYGMISPAITAGNYPTVFTITQDRPTFKIVATRTINWNVCEITTASLPDGQIGVEYSQIVTGLGFDPVSVWEISAGTFPPGLTINPTTGLISGTPTESNGYTFTVKRGVCSKEFSISITAPNCITNSTPLPTGTVGTPYSVQLLAPSLAVPLDWFEDSGTLPAGLSLNTTTGVISGTPTTEENASVTIGVIDDQGDECLKDFTIPIEAAPVSSCGWWEDFPLANDNIPTSPGVTATITPGGDLEGVANFNMSLQVDEDVHDTPQLSCSGIKTYTGVAITVKIHVEVTTFETAFGDPADISIYFLGGLVASITAVGSYDYDVHIPVSVAAATDFQFIITRGEQFDAGTIECDIEISTGNNDFVSNTGMQRTNPAPPGAIVYGFTGTTNSPSCSVALDSPNPFSWNVEPAFSTAYFPTAPTIAIDGVPITLVDDMAGFWRGSPALTQIDVDGCTTRVVTFSGTGPGVIGPFPFGGNFRFFEV